MDRQNLILNVKWYEMDNYKRQRQPGEQMNLMIYMVFIKVCPLKASAHSFKRLPHGF